MIVLAFPHRQEDLWAIKRKHLPFAYPVGDERPVDLFAELIRLIHWNRPPGESEEFGRAVLRVHLNEPSQIAIFLLQQPTGCQHRLAVVFREYLAVMPIKIDAYKRKESFAHDRDTRHADNL